MARYRQPPAETGNPLITVSSRAARRLRAGHVWVYRSDLIGDVGATSGAVIDVADEHGRALGTALYSDSSVIAVRLLTRKPCLASNLIAQIVPARIQAAVAYRERLVRNSDSYRVVFSEADELPGLIVDRYNDLVILQVLTQGFDRSDLRAGIIDRLVSLLKPRAVFEKMDARIQELERLAPERDRILWHRDQPGPSAEEPSAIGHRPSTAGGDDQEEEASQSLNSGANDRRPPDSQPMADGRRPKASLPTEDLPTANGQWPTAPQSTTLFTMNGVRLHFDALAGQKTGAFLDQRENYESVERYAHGEALDCFCYQGGFSLHLSRACERVTGVDSSRPALEVADQNAELNGRQIEWIEANAFDLLKDYATARRLYDTIVVDPPAFAKNRASLSTALRGYKELNLRAIRMLRPGGVLATCSCSYHVGLPDFLLMLASAAADAGRLVRVLEIRGAAIDHPAVVTIPETSYLKCVICSVA